MRNIQALLLLLFCLPLCAFAQPGDVPIDEAEVKRLLSHKWMSIVFEINGKTRKPIPVDRSSVIVLRSDGTFTDTSKLMGKPSIREGSWRYDAQSKNVYTRRGEGQTEKAEGKITKLTAEELILTNEPQEKDTGQVKGKLKIKVDGEVLKTMGVVFKRM